MRAALSRGLDPRPALAILKEQCYASAYQALDEGDDEDARRLFTVMALLAPRDERPWIGLAVSRERNEDWRAAAGLYQVGAVLVPTSAWCCFGRARALKRLGKQQQAERLLDRAEGMTDTRLLLAAIAQERSSP